MSREFLWIIVPGVKWLWAIKCDALWKRGFMHGGLDDCVLTVSSFVAAIGGFHVKFMNKICKKTDIRSKIYNGLVGVVKISRPQGVGL